MKSFQPLNLEGLQYDPFGMTLVGRNWNSGDEYRYGFNGNHSDEEFYGEDNAYDFGSRVLNSRLGRFLSIDLRAKDYPFWAPYLYAANSPITLIDIDGKGPGEVISESTNYQ